MSHSITTQNGKHIIDKKIRGEIIHALEHDVTYTYYDGIKIEIVSNKKSDDEWVTVVNVEGLWG